MINLTPTPLGINASLNNKNIWKKYKWREKKEEDLKYVWKYLTFHFLKIIYVSFLRENDEYKYISCLFGELVTW